MYITPNTKVESLDASSLNSGQVTFSFDHSPLANDELKYENIVAAADFINDKCRVKKLCLILRSLYGQLSTCDFGLASYLVQKIAFLELEVEFYLSDGSKKAATFLRSVAPFITTLKIENGYSGIRQACLEHIDCIHLAIAVGSLPKLRVLEMVGKYVATTIDVEFQRAVLWQCAQQNKMRLESLEVHGENLYGIGDFLISEAGSSLQKLSLSTKCFSRQDAIELTLGLKQNTVVSDLRFSLNECHGSAEDFLGGAPVFCSFLKEEKSIQSLHVESKNQWYKPGDGYSTLYGPLLGELKCKTTLKNLCLAIPNNQDSDLLKELLTHNQELTSVDFITYQTRGFNGELSRSIAQGLGQNQNVSSFSLKVKLEDEDELLEDVPLDAASIIQALAANQVRKLEFRMHSNLITDSSWVSLTQLLEQPQSALTSLKITIHTFTKSSILSLLQAMKECPSLKEFFLECHIIQGWDTADNYSEVFVAALGQASPGLTHVSVHLYDQEFEEAETEEMKMKTLDCMKANTQLEHVSLEPLNGYGRFDHSVKSFCTRNKGTKAADSLKDGTLDPLELPAILDAIEMDCKEIRESPDPHFVNIWFSLIHSRPLEAAKYCP